MNKNNRENNNPIGVQAVKFNTFGVQAVKLNTMSINAYQV